MKKIISLMAVVLFLTGCAVDDSEPNDEINDSSDVTDLENNDGSTENPTDQADLPVDVEGLSFEEAVVVELTTSMEGIAWEYEWLDKNACSNNGGYVGPLGQSLAENEGKMYDILTAECNDGTTIDYYFAIDNFFGQF